MNHPSDDTPPVLSCPDNIEVTADAEEGSRAVTWAVPVPVDNSALRPVLTSDPAVESGTTFSIGTTTITYTAEDLSQNVATCTFTIKVIG